MAAPVFGTVWEVRFPQSFAFAELSNKCLIATYSLSCLFKVYLNLRANAVAQDQPNQTHYDLLFPVNSTNAYTMMVAAHHFDEDMGVYIAIDAKCKINHRSFQAS